MNIDKLNLSDSSVHSTPPLQSPISERHAFLDGQSRPSSRRDSLTKPCSPSLTHRLRHDSSILAIALSSNRIYAGTQRGQILVFDLESLQRIAIIHAHTSSVLSLYLCDSDRLLFSSAGDRFINVWNLDTFDRVWCLYSSYDIGDVFCLAYSSLAHTIYLGAQNTSIQWQHLNLEEIDSPVACFPDEPKLQSHTFFDEGAATKCSSKSPKPRHAISGRSLELDKRHIHQYAHYGYVYSMLIVHNVISLLPGQDALISGGGDGVIKVWSLDTANAGAIKELFVLNDGKEEDYSVLCMAVGGIFLYTGRTGGQINVWDLETRQMVRSLRSDRSDVMSLIIGGGFLFNASAAGQVAMYDMEHKQICRLQAHHGSILASAVTIHDDRALYVTGANDNTIAVWDFSENYSGLSAASKSTNEQMNDCLKRFVAYKTVSSDPMCNVECRKGASYLRSIFKQFGAVTEMLPTENAHNPIILARFRGKPATAEHRKRILFYGHYDVVAADNSDGTWDTDPFSLEGMDGFLYGRGISDNKGPIMAAIFACAELQSEQSLDADVVFVIEGEEECGSRGFEVTIKKHKDTIGPIDWILLANSYWLDDRTPCLTYGLRGVIHATIQIESMHPDLHSGVDGSAQLDEPLKDLVMLLATLSGRKGEVLLPDFYKPIPALGAEEKQLYQEITGALLARNPDLGDPDELALALIRRWREASLTVHRFETSGPGSATIIPRLAKVALSMRLVPNQEAMKIAQDLEAYLNEQFASFGSHNKLTVIIDRKAEPWLGDVTNELFKTLEAAIIETWGATEPPTSGMARRRSSLLPVSPVKSAARLFRPDTTDAQYFSPRSAPMTSNGLANGTMTPALPAVDDQDGVPHTATVRPGREKQPQRRKPLYIREGGSIPAIRFLEKEFDAPAAHFPCGQASDSAHLKNERLRLVNLYNSKTIFRKVFQDLPQK